MRAVTFRAFGGPEVLMLEDLPSAAPPGDGEVAVDVFATTVNPTDLMMRSGQQAAMMADLPPPWIAGMEFAGVVVAAGQGALPIGTPVMGVVNPRRLKGGAYAQRILVPAASVVAVEHGTDLVAAATVPMNALTALLALEALNLKPGATLLVTGAAGVLGGHVVALAKANGLRVLANVSAADAADLRGNATILPRDDGMAAALRAIVPDGVDGLVDCALMGSVAEALVRDGGAAVSVRRSQPVQDPRLCGEVVSVLSGMERRDLLDRVGLGFTEGTFRPRVASGGVFPAERASDAHRMAETRGFRGRVVITLAS